MKSPTTDHPGPDRSDRGRGLFRRWELGIGGGVLLVLAALAGVSGQTPAPAVPASRFVGTWVGTQAWAISNPPPGASNEQPVTLQIDLADGRITGTMRPFLGGDDGATIMEATIVGDELRATAVVGRPRPAAGRGRGAGGNSAIRIAFVFRNDGLKMTGTADVQMGEVPWTKFRYSLGKKRSRY